jgi:hypothetical protein
VQPGEAASQASWQCMGYSGSPAAGCLCSLLPRAGLLSARRHRPARQEKRRPQHSQLRYCPMVGILANAAASPVVPPDAEFERGRALWLQAGFVSILPSPPSAAMIAGRITAHQSIDDEQLAPHDSASVAVWHPLHGIPPWHCHGCWVE